MKKVENHSQGRLKSDFEKKSDRDAGKLTGLITGD